MLNRGFLGAARGNGCRPAACSRNRRQQDIAVSNQQVTASGAAGYQDTLARPSGPCCRRKPLQAAFYYKKGLWHRAQRKNLKKGN